MKIIKFIWYIWVIFSFAVVGYYTIKNIDNWIGVIGGIVFIIYFVLMMRREMTDPKARWKG